MKITAQTTEEFREQLTAYLKQPRCTDIKNIIYFWKVENPISRQKGESNIVYIGQSSRSLNDRYLPTKAFNIEMDYFESFYKDAIKNHGALFIDIEETDTPERAEWEHLQAYRSEHLELPPLNRKMATKPPVD